MSKSRSALAVMFVALMFHPRAFAADTLLVSRQQALYEYTLAGDLLSQVPIPPGGDSGSRDIVQTRANAIAVFNGTFSPTLSVLRNGAWTSTSIAGWSTVNNLSFGGIASLGHYLYVTDMMTWGAEVRGLIRVDTRSGIHQRFLQDRDYVDVNAGLDGLLYGLRDDYGQLDVINPETMTIIAQRFLGHGSGSRSIAVDVDGTIFMASWNSYVAKYSAAGVELKRRGFGHSMMDIDINDAGLLVMGTRFGPVFVSDVELATATSFGAGWDSFVAFRDPSPHTLVATHAGTGIERRLVLNWTGGTSSIDVFRNGQLVYRGANTGTYSRLSMPTRKSNTYEVCNTGRTCTDTLVVPWTRY
jgi:hypothetical protein